MNLRPLRRFTPRACLAPSRRAAASLALALLLAISASAQRPHHHAPAAGPAEQLRFTLILSRHGIRPPLTPTVALNSFAAQPWPGWDVPLGHLTTHGALALAQMGHFLREDLAAKSLVPSQGCPPAASFYLYADTDQRNVASTRATFAAFAPGCPALPVFTFVPGLRALPSLRDPFFLPLEGTFLPPPPRTAIRHLRAALPVSAEAALSATDTPEHKAQIDEMARILAPDPAHPPLRSILSEKVSLIANPLGDPIVISRGPLPSASSLIEDLQLEYDDAKPMSDVGWGRVDEAAIRRLMPLHVTAFAYSHRTRYLARVESSNALAHVLETLDQAALGEPVRGALGPPGTRVVYISGHDTNLVGIAALLGLHWRADGRTDDTPPDSQIVFELWQRPADPAPAAHRSGAASPALPSSKVSSKSLRKAGDYTIRIRFRAQTINQLRNLTPLTLAAPPAQDDLIPTGCHAVIGCPYATFHHAAQSSLNLKYVKPDMLATHITDEN